MLILYKFILKSVIHTQSDTTFLGRVTVYPGRKHLCVDVEINLVGSFSNTCIDKDWNWFIETGHNLCS